MSDRWQWVLTERAQRDLRSTPRVIRARVFDALDVLAADPFPRHARKLAGSDDEWRIRVGDWRVRYRHDRDARRIVVVHVLPRGRAYRE